MSTRIFDNIGQFFSFVGLQMKVYNNGYNVTARGMSTKELMFQQYILSDVRYCDYNLTDVERSRMNTVIHELFLPEQKKLVKYSNKTIDDMTIGYLGIDFHKQYQLASRLIKQDPDTRQAVINFNNNPNFEFVPCTTQIQYMVRDKSLNCIVSMRSMDFINKAKLDIFLFSVLQHVMANETGYDLGQLYLNINSLHYYDKDKDKLEEILKNELINDGSKLKYPKVTTKNKIAQFLK